MPALSGEMGDKLKCSLCHRTHSEKCNKPKNATALNKGSEKFCSVFKKSAPKYKTKARAEGISKRVKDCPGFKSASNDEKNKK